jgi:transcriptional regulator
MKELLLTVSAITGVPENNIMGYRRDGKTSKARRVFILIANMKGYSCTRIAKFLGKTQPDISHQKKVMLNELEHYNDVIELYNQTLSAI